MKKIAQSGFSLVELLITISTVVALVGIGLSVYAQYQERAYNANALQQGMQIRTAFEAALSDRGSFGSSVFVDNPMLNFSIDGTLACVSGCGGIMPESLFPGYVHNPGISMYFNLFENTQSYQIQVGHCRALSDDGTDYDGWLVSDQAAASRVNIAADPSEIAQCAPVLAGETLTTPTATPSATPVPTPVCGDSICDSENGESADNCGPDCGDVMIFCGNGTCDPDESNESTSQGFCGEDCGCAPVNCAGEVCPGNSNAYCACVFSNGSCSIDCSGCPSPTPSPTPSGCPDPGNCIPGYYWNTERCRCEIESCSTVCGSCEWLDPEHSTCESCDRVDGPWGGVCPEGCP